MRVLLIDPARNCPELEPPLGLLYMAHMLERQGVACDVTSLNFDADFERLGGLIERTDYGLIGISVLSFRLGDALDAVGFVRARAPKIPLVLGGPHITALRAQGLEHAEADHLVYGEGEETLPDLVQALMAGDRERASRIPGTLFRAGDHWETNPPRPVNPVLDDFGYPRRDLIDTFEKHLAVPTGELMAEPCSTLMGSRGCAGRCTFCQPLIRDMFGNAVRCRAPESIAEETRYLRDTYGVASIQFADDMVLVATEWGEKLCQEMGRTGVPWAINSRVDSITPEVARRMADSGVSKVLFGIESGSDGVLRQLGKQVGRDHNIKALIACREAGIHVRASIMIGSPGETEDDLQQTLSMLQETRPSSIIVNFTKPTPGSGLYKQLSKKLRRAPEPDGADTALPRPVGAIGNSTEDIERLAARRFAEAPFSGVAIETLEWYRSEMIKLDPRHARRMAAESAST